MSETRINRRTAIGLIGGSAVALALGVGLVARERLDDDDPPAPPAAADTGSTGGIAAIGAAYLAATPDEQSEEALLAALGLPEGSTPDGVPAEQVQADFAAGDTLQLDGWLFAVSEARYAALVSLGQQTPTS